jgi:hypothetical protein
MNKYPTNVESALLKQEYFPRKSKFYFKYKKSSVVLINFMPFIECVVPNHSILPTLFKSTFVIFNEFLLQLNAQGI